MKPDIRWQSLLALVGLALFLLGGRLLEELRLLSNYLVVLYDYTYHQWDNSSSAVAQASAITHLWAATVTEARALSTGRRVLGSMLCDTVWPSTSAKR